MYQGRLESKKSKVMECNGKAVELNYKKGTKISGRGGFGKEVDRLRCSNFKDLTRKIFQLVFWIGGRLLREVR